MCEGHCLECAKSCWNLRLATKIVSGVRDTKTKTKCLALKLWEFNIEKAVDVCWTEETSRKKIADAGSRPRIRIDRFKNESTREENRFAIIHDIDYMFSLSERVIEEIIIYEINTDAIAEEIIISKKLERLRH